jgi:hypothetical protein
MLSPQRLFLFLVASWCLFLAVQWGDPFDETEHAHVAWQMAVRGQRPIADFFQHHQPLLWDLLEPYYLLGGGPEGLYFGRGLVVACAVVTALALRRLAGGSAGWLGLLPLLGASLALPSFWVLRPETLGTALFLAGIAAWVRRREDEAWWTWLAGDGAAGFLFAAALLATPRFLLLGGAFLLFRGRSPYPLLLRLVAWGAGLFVFLDGYLFLRPYSLEDIAFNLDASRVIGGIGEGYFKESIAMLSLAGGCLALAVWIGGRLDRPQRRRFLIRVGYGVLVLAASLLAAWPFLYAQNLFAPLVWLALMLADAEGRVAWLERSRPLRALTGLALAGCGACLLLTVVGIVTGKTIMRRVQAKTALVRLLQPGDRVLLSTATHPISIDDLSYYGHPLVDSHDRLPAAVRELRKRWPLPPCDFLAEVRRERPAVIDGFLLTSLTPEQQEELQQILDAEYRPLTPPIVNGQLLQETLFVRQR